MSDPRQPRLLSEVPLMGGFRRVIGASAGVGCLLVTGIPATVIDFPPRSLLLLPRLYLPLAHCAAPIPR